MVVDQPRIEGVSFVGIDDEGVAQAAAEHLVGLGHKRVGVVSFALASGKTGDVVHLDRQRSATYGPTRSRLRGYTAALEAVGLSWAAFPSTSTLRTCRPVAVSDQLALGVLEGARERGLSVPEEALSVVGFDDVPKAVRAVPSLTTVH